MSATATDELIGLLAKRYAPPEWAFFPQVRNGVGWYKGKSDRTADALAMNTFASRGLELHGFEVKSDRSDWLRELKHPEKADDLVGYCDRWWVVVPDAALLRPGELPPTWGLLVKRANGLYSEVVAPKLDAKPMDRAFLASLLRRAMEIVSPQAQLDAAYQQGFRAGIDKTHVNALHRYETLHEQVLEFEAKSGLRVTQSWRVGRIGEAVRTIMRYPHVLDELRRLKETAERVVQQVDDAMTGVEMVPSPEEQIEEARDRLRAEFLSEMQSIVTTTRGGVNDGEAEETRQAQG